MPVQMQNELGQVNFSDLAIASIAGITAVECYGVVGMAPTKVTDGLIELLRRENLTRGVKVTTADDNVSIDLYVIVEYGISINAVCTSVIDTIKYKMKTLLGLTATNIHVHVQSVRV